MLHRESLAAKLTRWIYSVAIIVLLPIYFVILCLKARKTSQQPLTRQFERLGWISSQLGEVKPGGVWFHCASVGEFVTASPLIKRLQQQRPELKVTVTTMTATGSDRVLSEFGDSVAHCYLPFDLPWLLASLVNHVLPQKLVITEVELWPNVLAVCARKNIQVDVINARMTERSALRYAKLSALFTPMLDALNHVYAQGQRDAEGYLSLGLEANKLTLSNNMKFDRAVSLSAQQPKWPGWSSLSGRFVLVAGSTHAPEEQMLLDALSSVSDVFIVLVPRYPDRFEDVAKLCDAAGVTWQRLSETAQVATDTNVLLVDNMGMLNECFMHASAAFVGGSIAARGGHNALEPAAQGLAIMMGPSRFNNPYICDALADAGALMLVDSTTTISNQLKQWQCAPELLCQAGQSGLDVLQRNAGALQKTLDGILAELH